MTIAVKGLDEARHALDLMTSLPLGVTVYSHITCVALDSGGVQVAFGSEFAISPGWWAWILETFAAGQLHGGVANALARLKRAAEMAG